MQPQHPWQKHMQTTQQPQTLLRHLASALIEVLQKILLKLAHKKVGCILQPAENLA
jgi:hypothetical protein